MGTPRVSIIVPTFERPDSLRLVLFSLGLQTGLSDADMEIVVADDGSQDETPEIVADFRSRCRFNVVYTTHQHNGFQLARTRNDGVRVSKAPYLIFLDGDCVAPRTHVAQHILRCRAQNVLAGFCYLLDRVTSARVDEAAIERNELERLVTARHRRQLTWMDWKARFYSLVRHPNRPKLYGGDIGIWRSDYEAINGFNEEFTGWGCEDDDFADRLRKARIQIQSILRWTHTFHLWHPPAPSYPRRWQDGANVDRLTLERLHRSARCEYGLKWPPAA